MMTPTLTSLIEESRKSSSDFRNGWYRITPLFAEELLRTGSNPRGKTIKAVVDRYAADMEAGKWKENGEPIIVNTDGKLQDGFHRLHAIIKSGVPQYMVVIFDAPVTKCYDYGKNRSVKEELGVSTLVTQISKTLERIIEKKECFGVGEAVDFTNKYRELLETAESIILSGKHGRAIAGKAMCGVIVAAMLKTGKIKENDMRMFFRVVNSMRWSGCPKNPNPALVMREQFDNISGGGRAVQSAHLAITYRALLAFEKNSKAERKIGFRLNDEEAVAFVKEAFCDETVETAA